MGHVSSSVRSHSSGPLPKPSPSPAAVAPCRAPAALAVWAPALPCCFVSHCECAAPSREHSLYSGIVLYIDFPFLTGHPGIHAIALYGTFCVLFLAHSASKDLIPDRPPSPLHLHPHLHLNDSRMIYTLTCTCTLRLTLLECHSMSLIGSLH